MEYHGTIAIQCIRGRLFPALLLILLLVTSVALLKLSRLLGKPVDYRRQIQHSKVTQSHLPTSDNSSLTPKHFGTTAQVDPKVYGEEATGYHQLQFVAINQHIQGGQSEQMDQVMLGVSQSPSLRASRQRPQTSIEGYQTVAGSTTANAAKMALTKSNALQRYAVSFNQGYTFVRNETTDGFSCKACNNRRARLDFVNEPLPATIDAIKEGHRNIIFVNNTPQSRAFIICPVAKNGCTPWKRLAMKLRNKYYLMPQHYAHKPKFFYHLQAANLDQMKRLVTDEDVPVIFVSRNPYVRLLSGYLDKHPKQRDQPYIGKDRRIRLRMRWYGTGTFAAFVKKTHVLYKLLGNKLSKSDGANHHFAQQARFCGFDHGLVYDYILKLERINEWYDGMIEDLGLRDAVQSGWPTDDDCFLSTPKRRCNGPYVQEHKDGGVTYVQPYLSPEHTTAAALRLQEYYTPELVAIVNEIYGDDFHLFNYTIWDGRGEPVLN